MTKLIQKYSWKNKGLEIAKILVIKKGTLALTHSKVYFKDKVTKAV